MNFQSMAAFDLWFVYVHGTVRLMETYARIRGSDGCAH